MTNDPEDWVCLKCFNRWSPRKEPSDKLQCTNTECRSRTTVRLSTLEENAESVQRAVASLPAPLGEFLTPPALRSNFPQLLQSSKDVIDQADPRASEGVNVFQSVLLIAGEWDPDTESLAMAVDRLAEEEGDT